jgi:RepB DNA-primase from phage plasmid
MNSKPSMPRNNNSPRSASSDRIASSYLQENFASDDRLAVVLLNKRTEDAVQRIGSAEKIAADDFQSWLRFQNANGCEIYVSMNALAKTARGRTKGDIETIRHVYLDFDTNGTAAVEKILARDDLPKPNYLLNTSPDKWQVIWKVEGFDRDQAEQLQRRLAQDMGADSAATDCSRVLRVPGFHNHKYSKPFLITCQTHARETYRPERFPQAPDERAGFRSAGEKSRTHKRQPAGGLSQSERDWAYARRALARGDREETVVAAIASYRRFDKPSPQYYAELTVRKAAESMDAARSDVQRSRTLDR